MNTSTPQGAPETLEPIAGTKTGTKSGAGEQLLETGGPGLAADDLSATAGLPDPTELPGADIVVWDGRCRFCLKQVKQLRRLDVFGQLSYLSLHDPRVAEMAPELSFEQLMEMLWVLRDDGQRFGGADAIRYLSRRLPTLWWLAPVMHLPLTLPLWRRMYQAVAQRRYRLAAKDCPEGTCSLHGKR